MDVGGGASRLVDTLLDVGYSNLAVVDISEVALGVSRRRLGCRASDVEWIVADARELRLAQPIDVWHDRAVFHFLVSEADQEAYVRAVRQSTKKGGHVVVATFAPAGPLRCSGLPVARHDAPSLLARFGAGFSLVRSFERQHLTPSGGAQAFTHAVLRYEGP